MKIKFDSQQDFQLDAIRFVVDVFAGQALVNTSLAWQPDAFGRELLTEMGVGNALALSEDAILANLQKIQSANGLEPVKAYDLRLVKRIEVDSVVDGAKAC